MIDHYNRYGFIILLLFTVPFYHFLFSRYLHLTKRHFSSDILVSFLDLSDLYICAVEVASQTIAFSRKETQGKKVGFHCCFFSQYHTE